MYKLTLPIKVETREETTWRRLLLDFGDAHIEQWCLALVLLRESLVSELFVSDGSGRPCLRLTRDEAISPGQRAKIRWSRDAPDLELGPVELEAWLHFFLKYHRDGFAEVDHIDLGIQPGAAGQKATDVTLRVAKAAPPVSGEEARRILGLDRKR